MTSKIELELPSTLTAMASYEWEENTDSYYWAVKIRFGSADVATVPFTIFAGQRFVGAENRPNQEDIDEFVANRLKGLFL